jgi:hypothetical protein
MHASFVERAEAERDIIVEFLSRLRGRYPSAHFVICHDNTGDPMKAFGYQAMWEADAQNRELERNRYSLGNPAAKNLGSRFTMFMDPKRPDLPGMRIDVTMKERMVTLARTYINNKKFYISPCEDFVTVYDTPSLIEEGAAGAAPKQFEEATTSPQAYADCVQKIGSQMKDYCLEVRKTRDSEQEIHSERKVTLSGKRWGIDDVAMAVQMCNFISFHCACRADANFNNRFPRSEAQLCETPFKVLSASGAFGW